MTEPTKIEAENDLQAIIDDVARLSLIVENMEMFIRDSGGEDRSIFKIDLLKWKAILEDGRNLIQRIQRTIEKL